MPHGLQLPQALLALLALAAIKRQLSPLPDQQARIALQLQGQPMLLIDDEPKLTEYLKMELELEGYSVEVPSDGASGLIALRGDPAPDLVLLDWNLPDFTDLEICRRIRATGMTVPVLMPTG